MHRAVIPVIVEQHAEEAAFLWLLRSYAVHAPHYRLKDLAKLDNRVEAHLDGLRIAGLDGWRLCEQALAIGEAGEVFAAAVLALESRDRNRLEAVYATVDENPDSLRGLVSAFGWMMPQQLSGTVKDLLTSDSPRRRQFGLAACAAHRVNPGAFLDAVVRDDRALAELRATALRAAGQLRRRDLLPSVRTSLAAEEPAVRFWAAWSSILLGDRSEAVESLKGLLVTGTRFRTEGLNIVLRAMNPSETVSWLKGVAHYPEWHRDVVVGTGILGDARYIPWLIKQMDHAPLARVAGEAFSLITGVDIAYEDLDGERPPGFEAGPTEDPKDDRVDMDRDEDLPWPDTKKLDAWWGRNSHRFVPGCRYLAGGSITVEQCMQVLREGYQRQRVAAALELASLQPGAPLFETRAPGWRQQRQLEAARPQ